MAWGDVVVVAINYRLNALGFLCLDTEEAAGKDTENYSLDYHYMINHAISGLKFITPRPVL